MKDSDSVKMGKDLAGVSIENQGAAEAADAVASVLRSKWKINNYRPYGIIARDPDESTYKVGDDKYPVIITTHGQYTRALAERIVSDHNDALPLTPLEEETERDAMIETIAELEQERDELRQLVCMSLQQFEFQYGKRKRGWDAASLMERLRAITQYTESSE